MENEGHYIVKIERTESMIDEAGVTSQSVKITDILHDGDTSNTFLNIDGGATNDEFYVDDSIFTSENSEYSIFMSNGFDGHSSSLKIDSCTFYKASESSIKWKGESTIVRNVTSGTSYAETVGMNMTVVNSTFTTTAMYGYFGFDNDSHANNCLFYFDNDKSSAYIDFVSNTWSNLVLDTFVTSVGPSSLLFLSMTVEDNESCSDATDSQLIRLKI